MIKTAIRFMLYDKLKTMGALFGVIIATFLIGQQSGIFIFLTNAMSSLSDNTRTDLWVVDPVVNNVNALGQIDARIGPELESMDGVLKAYPYLIAGGTAKFQNGKTYGVQLIGSQAPSFVGGPWKINQGSTPQLLQEGAVSYDFFDTKNLGNAQLGDYFEIGGRKVKLVLQTKGARGFGAVYLFTTLERARMLSRIPSTKVSAFLIKVKNKQELEQVKARINKSIPGVKAYTPQELSSMTVKTVLGSSGIAISTGTLVLFAIISGLIIVGLTLFSSAVDRIRDYATMKAIGATNGYISKLILIQAMIIGLLGFTVGSLLLEGFRNGIANAGVLFQYSLALRAVFLAIIVVISIGGGLMAVWKISKTEPASVFRN
ncbi:MAG: ABC transporter permease [Cytophagaceae bacterium]|jgi:putative ABC transport system permease protein|nr:ABC transporter permease [Cytophagaceae bacterium]